jgi:outer membrane protein
MKRLSVFALTLALASTAMAAAQSTAAAPKPAAPAGPTKVAVVAFQVALAQTNEFQRDLADLQKKYDPKKTQLKALNDEIENLTKQLQSSSAQLSDAERVNRTRTLDEKKKQLERESQDAQSDFQADMQQLIGKMANKVGAVMTDYAEKNGFTLVLDAGDEHSSSVLYAVESTNITKAIIDAYNQKSGVPAPPAQPAAVDAPQPAPAH